MRVVAQYGGEGEVVLHGDDDSFPLLSSAVQI